MFYCETCQEEQGWPGFIPTSFGACEVCRRVTRCYDISSTYVRDWLLEKDKKDMTAQDLGHYVITVSLKYVTPKGPGLMGTPIERTIEDLLTTTVKADSLPEAVRRAKAVIDVAAAPPAA